MEIKAALNFVNWILTKMYITENKMAKLIRERET